jgi:hypothetical protein
VLHPVNKKPPVVPVNHPPPTPDVLTLDPTGRPVYFTDLVNRLFTRIELEMAETQRKYHPRKGKDLRVSLSGICRKTGIPRRTMIRYHQRTVNIPIERLDYILWAMKLSLVDLFDPAELEPRYLTSRRAIEVGTGRTVPRFLKKTIDTSGTQG